MREVFIRAENTEIFKTLFNDVFLKIYNSWRRDKPIALDVKLVGELKRKKKEITLNIIFNEHEILLNDFSIEKKYKYGFIGFIHPSSRGSSLNKLFYRKEHYSEFNTYFSSRNIGVPHFFDPRFKNKLENLYSFSESFEEEFVEGIIIPFLKGTSKNLKINDYFSSKIFSSSYTLQDFFQNANKIYDLFNEVKMKNNFKISLEHKTPLEFLRSYLTEVEYLRLAEEMIA